MAIKRSFNLTNEKARTCLKCARVIAKDTLRDDIPHICPRCGQGHFVDIYGTVSCCLTLMEKPGLRRRHTNPEATKEILLALQLDAAEKRATNAERAVVEWKKAAEGLVSVVEKLTEEKRIREGIGK